MGTGLVTLARGTIRVPEMRGALHVRARVRVGCDTAGMTTPLASPAQQAAHASAQARMASGRSQSHHRWAQSQVHLVAPEVAARYGPVADTETEHLHAATLTEALVELLRARGVLVSAVDVGAVDDHRATHVLTSCAHETFTPDSPHISPDSPSSSNQALDVFAGGVWRWWFIEHREEHTWRRVTPSMPEFEQQRRRTLDFVLLFLTRHNSNPHPWLAYLTGTAWEPTIDPQQVTASRDAALRAWFETRVREGHTPGPEGSAQFLLGFFLPPDLLSRLTYASDGTPTLAP